MNPAQPDDDGRSIRIDVIQIRDDQDFSYRIESDSDALTCLRARAYRTLKPALRAAMRIGRRYRNGAVIFIISADGERVGSAVYRPPRALLQALSEASITFFEAALFLLAAIASGTYFWRWGDVYVPDTTDLIGPLQTAMGLAVVATTILASVGAAATLRVAFDHKNSWALRRDVIVRSVMLVGFAILALPVVVVAYFVNNEILVTSLVAVLSGLLCLFIVGTVRILTSVYCYAVDVTEQA